MFCGLWIWISGCALWACLSDLLKFLRHDSLLCFSIMSWWVLIWQASTGISVGQMQRACNATQFSILYIFEEKGCALWACILNDLRCCFVVVYSFFFPQILVSSYLGSISVGHMPKVAIQFLVVSCFWGRRDVHCEHAWVTCWCLFVVIYSFDFPSSFLCASLASLVQFVYICVCLL